MNNKVYITNLIDKIRNKQSQLDIINNTISTYNNEIDKKFREILKENNIEYEYVMSKNKKCEGDCCHHNINKSSSNDEFMIPNFTEILNSLHKQLCIKTHPDKNGSSENSNKLCDDFINIQKAYEDNDIFILIIYANKYDIFNYDIDKLTISLSFIILEKKKNKLTEQINFVKNTIGYSLLINGNITKYISELKMLIELEKENEIYRQKNELLKNKLKENVSV